MCKTNTNDVNLETLAAISTVMANTNLHVNMKEFLLLLQSISALPEAYQRQIVWATVGMSAATVANLERTFTNG